MATKKKLLQVSGGAEDYWIATLGSSGGTSYAFGGTVDSSNNVIVVGRTDNGNSGDDDALVVKYNSSGELEWQKRLGGTIGDDQFYKVITDNAGNIYCVGNTLSDGAGQNDILVAKYNSSGVLQWDKIIGGTANDYGRGIAIDSSGNIIVLGYTYSYGVGNGDFILCKINSSGVVQWTRTIGGSSNELSIGSIDIDSSDSIYIHGYTASAGAGGVDMYLAKFTSSGTVSWQRTLGGTGADRAYEVKVDDSDNVYVAAVTYSEGAGSADALLVKYNSSGTLQWQRRLGGTGVDLYYSVSVNSSGDVLAAGYTNSDGEGSNDMLIVKYNSSGTFQWAKTLGYVNSDLARQVAFDSKNNVIFAGYYFNTGPSNYYLTTGKIPPDGSADGTYGQIVFQDYVGTEAAATLTSASASLTVSSQTVTSADAVLTDATAALTDTLYTVTP